MAKQTKKKDKSEQPPQQNEAWIPQKTGNVIIAIVSIGLAVWITWTLREPLGLGEAILWGLGFGAAIWGVYYGMQVFTRWIRRR